MTLYFRFFFIFFIATLAGSIGAPQEVAPVKEADIHSPFKSTLTSIGIDIPNAHLVEAAAGKVFRGEQPGPKVDELAQAGITDILIFKSSVQDEVAHEITLLHGAGYKDENISNIEFPWRDFPDLKVACRQTIQALNLLKLVHDTKGRSIYFHCTVGEDRTGFLAGLYRILVDGWSVKAAWDAELCGHGFGAADPNKPASVIDDVNKGLRPLFFQMASLIEKSGARLEACDQIELQTLTLDPAQHNCTPLKIN